MEKNETEQNLDFNELREAFIDGYNDLVKKLNDSVINDKETGNKIIKIEPFNLKNELFEMGRLIGMLASTSKVGNKELPIIKKKLEVLNY